MAVTDRFNNLDQYRDEKPQKFVAEEPGKSPGESAAGALRAYYRAASGCRDDVFDLPPEEVLGFIEMLRASLPDLVASLVKKWENEALALRRRAEAAERAIAKVRA